MININNEIKRRRDRRVRIVFGGIFIIVFLFTFLMHCNKVMENDANAANLAAFDPGYIISDYQMGNYNSMNEAQIQAFLKSKNSCNDTYISRYTMGEKVSYFSEVSPPRTWHVKDGHFVCMADEVFDGGTAAHIIYNASQEYRINPQVLLVLLEKEQSLVSDTFPHSQQYRSATGYGCPDTAACSSKYYGLKNQIRNAAALFRTVLDGGWTNYPLGNNYIQYNPNASCGGSVVNIKNLATSALYRYTPYQPNAATLGGWSDGCNAYGNMNFYSLFEDWFGGITMLQKNTNIPDGVYYIQLAKKESFVVDVDSGKTANGANVQLFDKNNTLAQQWMIKRNPVTDDYSIINIGSGKALDVYEDNVDNGTNVQLWDKNDTCMQRWKIVRTEEDKVKILSTCSYKALDVAAGVAANESNIQVWADNSTDAQKWKLVPVDDVADGLYYIVPGGSNDKVLDISGGAYNTKNGTNIHLWGKNYTGAQRWFILRGEDGYYTIKNKQSGKVLDVSGASAENGANIQVWSGNGTCAQKWRILKNEDGYTFISACSYGVLDLYSASVKSGTNIQLYEANNTNAQKWKLEPISIVKDDSYTIRSGLANNKVIDVTANSPMRGTNIQLYNNNDTSAQLWRIIYDDNNDTYTILNEGVDKVMDVAAAGVVNKTNIQTWQSNGTCAQRWIISNVSDMYIISSLCSGLVVDVDSASIVNGTNIQLYEYNNTKAQKWLLSN